MTTIRFLLIALLAGSLAVSACGKKGDPVRPGEIKDKKTTN